MKLCAFCKKLDLRWVGYHQSKTSYTHPTQVDRDTRQLQGGGFAPVVNPDVSQSFKHCKQGISAVLRNKESCSLCWSISQSFERWEVDTKARLEVSELKINGGDLLYEEHNVFPLLKAQSERLYDRKLLKFLDVKFRFTYSDPTGIVHRQNSDFSVRYQRSRRRPSMTEDFLQAMQHDLTRGILPYEGRAAQENIDTRLFAEWGRLCQSSHGTQCSTSPFRVSTFPDMLRLIDVNRMCLVERPIRDLSWVALSYVWGARSFVTLTAANLSSLTTLGGLSALQLPSTISDVIEVAKVMGEVFVWIDSLCIIQDSDVDKARFISQMHIIYSLASVTIVDLAGKGVYDGLPGVRIGTRPPQEPSVNVTASGWRDNRFSPRQIMILI